MPGKASMRARRLPLGVWALAVVRARIRQLERALDRLEKKPDAEAIHEVRVAARRLRAGLRHLAPCFGGNRGEKLRAAVSRVAGALGKVRDLDILIENLADDAGRPGSSFSGLVKRMEASRADRLQRVLPEARLLRHQLSGWHDKLAAKG